MAQVSDRVVLLKVTSHVDPTNYTCAEQFVLSGHEWADRWASYALCQMPAWIRQLSSQARQEVDLLREGTEAAHAHFVRVGLTALQVKSPHQSPPARPLRCQYEHDTLDTIAFSRWLRWHSPDKLRFRGLDRIITFWEGLSDPHAPPLLYAWHELYIAWQLQSGLIGVSRHRSGWRIQEDSSQFDFPACCKSWATYSQCCIRAWNPKWRSIHGRPSNPAYIGWTGCLRLKVAPHVRDSILDFFRTNSLRAIKSDVIRFARLGPAFDQPGLDA